MECEPRDAAGLRGSSVGIEIGVSQWIIDAEGFIEFIASVTVDDIDEVGIIATQPPPLAGHLETRKGRIKTLKIRQCQK